jgi:hypothetical protein
VHRFALIVPLALVACRFDPAGVGDETPSPEDASVADAQVTSDTGDRVPDAALAMFCDDADPTLRACYRFEPTEQSTQPFDESSFANHGITTGAMFGAGRPGAGDALVVGSSSLVTVPDSASLDIVGPITLELWLRVDATPPAAGRAGLLDDNGQWGLFLSPAMEVRCTMSTTTVIGLTIPMGEWTHVACVYDRQTVQLYMNGDTGPSVSQTAELPTTGTDGVRIGQNSPTGDPLTGALDDVRIWSRALTPLEVCAAAGSCAP